MNIKILFLLLLFTFSLALKAHCQQNDLPDEASQFLAIYRLTFQPDSTDATVRRNELMRLAIGKSTSAFESIGKYAGDSLYATVVNLPFEGETAQLVVDKFMKIGLSRFNYIIYKNRFKNILYTYDKIDEKLFYYSEKLPADSWKLLPDKQVIAGYACQRASIAFAGRHFEAWFTREIPLPDGPYKFGGLPGLIIQLSDTRQQYSFELVSFRKVTLPAPISLPTQPAIEAPKADVQRARRDHYTNLPALAAARTNTIITTAPESEQAMKRRLQKKYNNALEIH